MSKKKKARLQKKTAALPKSKRNIIVGVCLLLGLSLVGSIFAWRAARIAGLHPMLAPSTTVPPPGSPSKEYIYAGGRLVATEEPINMGSTLSAPANFNAHANASTQISLSWASTGAPTYLIEWSTNYQAANQGFTSRTTIDCTAGCPESISYTDSVPAGTVATTYLYRVRSVSGAQQSVPSTFDFATTKSFAEQIQNQDPPGRTAINATHFLELREAVNAVRTAAGLAPFAWSDPQGRVPISGGPILRSHMLDLRNGLDQALSSLGFTPQSYWDQGLPAGTSVRKFHIDEIRQRTKSVGQ